MFRGFMKAIFYSVFTLVFSVAIFVFFTSGDPATGETSIFGAAIVLILFIAVMLAIFLGDIGKGLKGDGWDGGYGTPGDE